MGQPKGVDDEARLMINLLHQVVPRPWDGELNGDRAYQPGGIVDEVHRDYPSSDSITGMKEMSFYCGD